MIADWFCYNYLYSLKGVDEFTFGFSPGQIWDMIRYDRLIYSTRAKFAVDIPDVHEYERFLSG